METVIYINSVYDASQFVTEITSIKSDIDAIYNNSIVDAKSYLGILLVSAHPLTIRLHSDDEEEIKKFIDICEKYNVKE